MEYESGMRLDAREIQIHILSLSLILRWLTSAWNLLDFFFGSNRFFFLYRIENSQLQNKLVNELQIIDSEIKLKLRLRQFGAAFSIKFRLLHFAQCTPFIDAKLFYFHILSMWSKQRAQYSPIKLDGRAGVRAPTITSHTTIYGIQRYG